MFIYYFNNIINNLFYKKFKLNEKTNFKYMIENIFNVEYFNFLKKNIEYEFNTNPYPIELPRKNMFDKQLDLDSILSTFKWSLKFHFDLREKKPQSYIDTGTYWRIFNKELNYYDEYILLIIDCLFIMYFSKSEGDLISKYTFMRYDHLEKNISNLIAMFQKKKNTKKLGIEKFNFEIIENNVNLNKNKIIGDVLFKNINLIQFYKNKYIEYRNVDNDIEYENFENFMEDYNYFGYYDLKRISNIFLEKNIKLDQNTILILYLQELRNGIKITPNNIPFLLSKIDDYSLNDLFDMYIKEKNGEYLYKMSKFQFNLLLLRINTYKSINVIKDIENIKSNKINFFSINGVIYIFNYRLFKELNIYYKIKKIYSKKLLELKREIKGIDYCKELVKKQRDENLVDYSKNVFEFIFSMIRFLNINKLKIKKDFLNKLIKEYGISKFDLFVNKKPVLIPTKSKIEIIFEFKKKKKNKQEIIELNLDKKQILKKLKIKMNKKKKKNLLKNNKSVDKKINMNFKYPIMDISKILRSKSSRKIFDKKLYNNIINNYRRSNFIMNDFDNIKYNELL